MGKAKIIGSCKSGFNPCCIGRYAKSILRSQVSLSDVCFNPCCIGRYAKSLYDYYKRLEESLFQSLLYWKIC